MNKHGHSVSNAQINEIVLNILYLYKQTSHISMLGGMMSVKKPDTWKALRIQCYTHVGVGQNLISCLSPDAIINQPIYLIYNYLLYSGYY